MPLFFPPYVGSLKPEPSSEYSIRLTKSLSTKQMLWGVLAELIYIVLQQLIRRGGSQPDTGPNYCIRFLYERNGE